MATLNRRIEALESKGSAAFSFVILRWIVGPSGGREPARSASIKGERFARFDAEDEEMFVERLRRIARERSPSGCVVIVGNETDLSL